MIIQKHKTYLELVISPYYFYTGKISNNSSNLFRYMLHELFRIDINNNLRKILLNRLRFLTLQKKCTIW